VPRRATAAPASRPLGGSGAPPSQGRPAPLSRQSVDTYARTIKGFLGGLGTWGEAPSARAERRPRRPGQEAAVGSTTCAAKTMAPVTVSRMTNRKG
jgi:hypothetical protein